MIRYSEDELQKMIDQLASYYEQSHNFQDFVTLNVVKHPRRPFPEDTFRYIRRHTLGRPRDLVIIASELSSKRDALNDSQFCTLVNETSATGLVANIFDEMRVFLNCLVRKSDRQRFFDMIPHNILTLDEAIRICCLYNGLSADAYDYYQAHAGGLHHPFCDLYRVGLLGTITRGPDGKVMQQFKQPHDFINSVEAALPHSPYYFLHPALDEHIGQMHIGKTYHLFQHVIVGDGQVWEEYFDVFCQIERCLFDLPDQAAIDAVYRLLNEARIVLSSDRLAHLQSILEASTDLEYLRSRNEPVYEEVQYWLEELVHYGS